MIEYDAVVNALGLIVLILTGLLFLIYLISFLVRYAKGDEVCWNNDDLIFNPFKNTAVSNVFMVPLLFGTIGLACSFTWFVSIPAIVIFTPLYFIRQRILHKKKMWTILKDVK